MASLRLHHSPLHRQPLSPMQVRHDEGALHGWGRRLLLQRHTCDLPWLHCDSHQPRHAGCRGARAREPPSARYDVSRCVDSTSCRPQGTPLLVLLLPTLHTLCINALQAGKTSAPDYLSEAELIGLMEKHGIGTDASIAVHINNICERGYVSLTGGRRLKPTVVGAALVHGYCTLPISAIYSIHL